MKPPTHSTPLFAMHNRSWRDNRYVYPVISRRSRGLSIGVNLNPDGACNFNCVYCCVDRTGPLPSGKVALPVLVKELDLMLDAWQSGQLFEQPPFDQTPEELRRLNDIAFSGDGEPTASPLFLKACQAAAGALDRRRLFQAKIVVITNATLLHRPAVKKALEFLDTCRGEVWGKLDAGTEPYYHLIERTKVPFQQVLDNLLQCGQVRPMVIQSLFLELDGQGPDDAEIDAYLERLRWLRSGGCQIRLVQIYTVARRTSQSNVLPLADQRIDEISGRVRDLGLEAEGFYGVRA